MSFSIFVTINSIVKNEFNGSMSRTPFKANPTRHYRQMATMNTSKSSNNTHMTGHYNGIPGGTSKCIVKTNIDDSDIDCDKVGIVRKIEINKPKYTLAFGNPDTCSTVCADPEKIARNNVRQSNTTIKEGFFSRGIGYLQNRNMTSERKTSNWLDREESIKLYGSYDKQKFFLRNSHTTGSLAPCAVSYYKPTNNQFAQTGAVVSSSLTGRKKYNVNNLCRSRVPTNDYFFGITQTVDRKRNKKRSCCFPPNPNEVTYEKLQKTVNDIMSDIVRLRDIVNDNDANVILGKVEKIANGDYNVPIIINKVNVSQLNETETVGLLSFLREKFEINNINPDLSVNILGSDSIDYNTQFRDLATRFYVDPSTLRINYLENILKNPDAFIEKTDYVRINDNENTTVIEMELDGLYENLTDLQKIALDQYLKNLYLFRYGVSISEIEFI